MTRLLAAALLAAVLAGHAVPAAAEPNVPALVDQAAARYGIPRDLAHGVARVESGYRCALRGRHGERGVMQVKPETARSVGISGNLFDCATGIEAGMRYLRIALDRGGGGCAGVSLYQRGVFARPRCTAYGRTVMRVANTI